MRRSTNLRVLLVGSVACCCFLATVRPGQAEEEAWRFLEGLRLFPKAESLGGIESLCCHPASMTHAAVPGETREAVGITDSLVRFSIGIESVEDLITDVLRALRKS